jgi:hypothetical protein
MRKLLLGVLVLCSSLAFGDEPASSLPGALAAGSANMKTGTEITAASASEPANAALPAPPSELAMKDPQTRQKYFDSMQRYYQYREDGFAFRSRVFEWQLFSSRLIFATVVLLVLAGLCFAAIQFYVAMVTATRARGRGSPAKKGKSPDTSSAPPAEATAEPASPLATQLEISAKGIIVNSSVLGVVVLALSLAFFYLYLVYVYPIHEVI